MKAKNTDLVHEWAKGFFIKRSNGKVYHPYTYKDFKWVIVLFLFSSCSASWHVNRAMKKDPSIFDTKSKTELMPMTIPPAQFAFDCAEINDNPITLYSPILYLNPVTGKTKRDSVKVELSGKDGKVTAVVDCPDVEVAKETITTTITLKTPLWQFMSMCAGAFVAGWVLRKIIN
jgi:hypothetical protein